MQCKLIVRNNILIKAVLIIALAEVLDVLPIMNRRVKIRKGISFIVIALARGTLVGSLCYWIYPYFTEVYLS